MEIDRHSKTPVYRQIYIVLAREILVGRYDEKKLLPGEHSLSTRFGVERGTLRKALVLLVEDGLVLKVPGLGTKIISSGKPPHIAGTAPSTPPQKGARESVLLISQDNYLESGHSERFHFCLLRGFEKQLSGMGYNLIIKSISEGTPAAELIEQANPAAVILNSHMPAQICRDVLAMGLPSVSVNHHIPAMTSVVSSNADGACEMTRLLMEAGHRRIAFIMGKSHYQTNIERLSGVRRMYRQKEKHLPPEYLFQGDYRFDSGFEAGQRILAMGEERPTAVFAFNDDMAYGCCSCFRRHGVQVPQDISVAGFDRSERLDMAFDPITTVDVNIEALISYACWYLSGRLTKSTPDACVKIQVETHIIDRGTVRRL